MGLPEQIAEEARMQTLGIRRYRRASVKADDKKRMSTHGAGTTLLAVTVPKLAVALKEACDLRRIGSGGRRSRAIVELRQLDPEVAALIAVRTIFDTLCETRKLGSTTFMVGSRIEDELRFRMFKRVDRGGYKNAIKKIGNSRNYQYQHKVLVHMMKENVLVPDWERWGTNRKTQVGAKLVELMLAYTGTVKLVHLGGTAMLLPTQEMLDNLVEQDLRLELLHPWFLPTTDEPKAWEGASGGGYHAYDMPLVKKRESALFGVGDDFEPTPCILEALNDTQNTSWSINCDVLEVVTELWKREDLELPGIPARTSIPEPERPDDLPRRGSHLDEVQKEILAGWRHACGAALADEIQRRSKLLTATQILAAARELVDRKRFYFPHQLDWRGRAYSVPSFLSPQGPDLARGMMQFAEGRPFGTEAGRDWFLVTGANHFGYDKVSFADRVAWVHEHVGHIKAVADDPITCLWWMDAKEEYQFLAWCLEYAKWQESGGGLDFVSHKVVGQDGSCNGLQHYSAMLRDPRGGRAVNLLPNLEPEDIYEEVAAVVAAKLEACATVDSGHGRIARMWLKSGLLNRDVVKRQVMTLPYGATQHGMQDQLLKHFKKLRGQGVDLPFEDVWDAALFLTGKIYQAIGEVVVAAGTAMGWLQQVSRIVSKRRLPMRWKTPHGFRVVQAYRSQKKVQVETQIMGRLRLNMRMYKDTISPKKQSSGIAPNFVHSLDSCHMMQTVHAMGRNPLDRRVSWAIVHDSFGCHAGDAPRLAATLRCTFVELYEKHDVLAEFKADIEADLGIQLPDPPPRGELDIQEVLKSDFFFA